MNTTKYAEGTTLRVCAQRVIKVRGNNRRVAVQMGDVTTGVVEYFTYHGQTLEYVKLTATRTPGAVAYVPLSDLAVLS